MPYHIIDTYNVENNGKRQFQNLDWPMLDALYRLGYRLIQLPFHLSDAYLVLNKPFWDQPGSRWVYPALLEVSAGLH